MSKKNGHTIPPYISRVHLKGYKSIIDTKVDLHPGLNIIIGPNGSGKTNFLELLNQIVSLKNYTENHFDATLKLFDIKGETYSWQIKAYTVFTEDNQFFQVRDKISTLSKSKTSEKNDYKSGVSLAVKRTSLLENFNPISFINFSLPENINRLSKPITVAINKKNSKIELPDLSQPATFIFKFLFRNFFGKKVHNLITKGKESILEQLEVDEELRRNFKKFSPIKNVRIGEGVSVKENGISYYINYIEFEFLVNDHWISWNMLSDGTKRLFYLISEVTLNKGLCLIEEPEIGVHPNQYLKILTFLRESAEEKQIIITTHRPRSLDILKDEELKRIILTRYDNEKGTKMRHLTKKEIKLAIKYRENEGSTSELWSYTGFFDEEDVI